MIKNLKRRKVYPRQYIKDNFWAADLAEMGSLAPNNRGVKYLLCVIDLFTKYAWVKPLKDKKTFLHGFVKIVNKSKQKPNKLWVGQGREFYNTLMQKMVRR